MSDKSVPFSATVKPEKIPPYTVFIDTETFTNGEYQCLMLGCAEVWRTTKAGLPDHRKPPRRLLFRSESEFYALIGSLHSCRVVAHNWQFDAAVLRIGSRSTTETYGYRLDPSRGIYPACGSGFSPFWIHMVWQSGQESELIDNTNFHKTSLAKLGASYGLDKLDMPPLPPELLDVAIPASMADMVQTAASDDMETNHSDYQVAHLLKVIRYCRRDVEILRRAWFSLFQFSNDVAMTTPGITVASMTQRLYAARWFPRLPRAVPLMGSLGKPPGEAEGHAYRGGRVETYWHGDVASKGELYKYDANSMYPSVMIGPMPTCYVGVVNSGKLKRCLKRGLDQQALHLADVTVEVPTDGVGWLGWEGVYSDDMRLIFPCGKFRLWTWTPQLRIAYEEGWIKEVHTVYEYSTYPVFDDFVTEVYAMRKKAKEEGDIPTSLLYKYLLNSLYGKFGQGNYGKWEELGPGAELNWQRGIHRDGPRWSEFPTGMETELREYWESEGSIWAWVKPEPGFGKRSVGAVAGYITASARAKLLRTMHVLHRAGHRIYMTDTDSIVTDGILDPSMVGKELGAWDLEETAPMSECSFDAAKHYCFGGKQKIKGIRQPKRNQYEYEQAQFSKWATDALSVKEARRERLEQGARVVPIVKRVTGTNTKRIVGEDNAPTEPIVLG